VIIVSILMAYALSMRHYFVPFVCSDWQEPTASGWATLPLSYLSPTIQSTIHHSIYRPPCHSGESQNPERIRSTTLASPFFNPLPYPPMPYSGLALFCEFYTRKDPAPRGGPPAVGSQFRLHRNQDPTERRLFSLCNALWSENVVMRRRFCGMCGLSIPNHKGLVEKEVLF